MALGFMRRHRRWLYVFLWLVIAAFIILYIPAFQDAGSGSAGEVLASVGDLKVTAGEYRKTYLRQRQAYENLYQDQLTPELMASLGLEEQVLQSLLAERLIVLEARRLGLSVDDETVARELATAPEFQIDGRFIGAEEIRRRLALQGVTVAEFETSLRNRLLKDRLEALVADAAVVSDAEAEREFRRRNEQVRIEYVRVDADAFDDATEASDAEIAQRFAAHASDYRMPEKRVVSYALLDPKTLQPQVSVTDGEISSYYDARRGEFRQDEQVCASHILVKVAGPEGGEGHTEDEARRIAEGLLARVSGGEDFAAVATSASEDAGSAPRGGDLGCFPRGRMVPQFEDAAFALEAGETSGLVRSGFGFHVIRVRSRVEAGTQPLEQVQGRIRQVLARERLGDLVAQRLTQVQASLESGRSLEDAAASLTLTTTEPYSRSQPPEALDSPALVAEVFGLAAGAVSSQPQPAPDGYVFVRVDQVIPSRDTTLEEVRDRVAADVKRERALERAREAAVALAEAARSRGLAAAAAARKLTREETPALVSRGQGLGELGRSAAVDQAVFSLEPETVSDPVSVEGGWAVVRVVEKRPFDPTAFAAQKESLKASLLAQRRNQLFQAYMDHARERFPVRRNEQAIRGALG